MKVDTKNGTFGMIIEGVKYIVGIEHNRII